MKRILIVVLLLICGLVYAHNQAYQDKDFTFYSPQRDHKIDVMLEGHNNELSVRFDNVEIGTRTSFCTPVEY